MAVHATAVESLAMTGSVSRRGQPVIDRASPTDRAFLAMDTGEVPEQFGVILLLDQADGFDLSRARRLIAERIPAVPRLRQRLVRTPFGCGGPIWVDDPHFDIRRHVRAVTCGEPGDEPALLDTALAVIVAPLPRTAPLWSAVLVTGLVDGRLALMLVLHHALADGVGGLAVLANLVDAQASAPSVCFPRPAPTAVRLAREAFLSRWRGLRHSAHSWHLLRMSMGAGGGLRPPRAASLFAEPADGIAPAAGGGPCRYCDAEGRRAPARRDHQRCHPGRSSGRTAPAADGKRRTRRHACGDRAGLRPPPR
jgi:hypothetical protein